MMTSPAANSDPRTLRLHLVLFCLLLLASKFLLIASYGSPTPLWDQWEIEGRELFGLALRHQLPWPLLFASYNEHRIVMTRLLDLLLLALNGQVWNPMLQLIVNAVLHVTALAVLLRGLQHALPRARQAALLLFATVLFCTPCGYENTLWGFQSQIYFVLLFSILSLWYLSTRPPFSAHWYLGMLYGLLGLFSFGSGATTFFAAFALQLLRQRAGADPAYHSRGALVLLAALGLLAIAMTPSSPELYAFLTIASPFQQLKLALGSTSWTQGPAYAANPVAQTLPEFLGALLDVASWPTFFLAPLVYFPLLQFLWRQLRRPPDSASPSWFVFAMGLWALAQLLLFSYGRAKSPLLSRYTDFYSIGILLNFCCLLPGYWIPATALPARLRQLHRPFPVVWVVLVLLGLAGQTALGMKLLTAVIVPSLLALQEHVVGYLATGDVSWLNRNEYARVLPSLPPEYIKVSLDDPVVRQLLPPNLAPANLAREPAWVRLLIANLRTLGLFLLTVGLGLGFYLFAAGNGRQHGAGQKDESS